MITASVLYVQLPSRAISRAHLWNRPHWIHDQNKFIFIHSFSQPLNSKPNVTRRTEWRSWLDHLWNRPHWIQGKEQINLIYFHSFIQSVIFRFQDRPSRPSLPSPPLLGPISCSTQWCVTFDNLAMIRRSYERPPEWPSHEPVSFWFRHIDDDHALL